MIFINADFSSTRRRYLFSDFSDGFCALLGQTMNDTAQWTSGRSEDVLSSPRILRKNLTLVKSSPQGRRDKYEKLVFSKG